MRDIKFRAWDGKRFHLWGFNLIGNGTFTGSPNPLFPNQQYTGLKDKNGKEIYEEDIVRILYTDWPSKSENDRRTLDEYKRDISHIAEVIFNNVFHRAEFELSNQDWRGDIAPGRHGEIEVIGNIYENPELLNKE